MKSVKYLSMMLTMLAMSICFVSCSDDDDEATSSYNDYFISIDVEGGGFDASEINEVRAALNTELSTIEMEAIDKEQAIYIFDRFMKNTKSEFSNGLPGVEGTLYLHFYLKTRDDGTTVKKSTLKVTKDSCTL